MRLSKGSICDAIVTPTPGELTFPVLKRHAGPGFAVSDKAVFNAMKVAFDTLKLVIEPWWCLSLLRPRSTPLRCRTTRELVVVASGGNVDEHVFQQALQFN
jgi:threonine dehydratase